jgi:DNA mismatch repair protein MutH
MKEVDLRFEVTNRLKVALREKNLAEIAKELQITIKAPNGHLNKGWIGQTLDKLINLAITNVSSTSYKEWNS